MVESGQRPSWPLALAAAIAAPLAVTGVYLWVAGHGAMYLLSAVGTGALLAFAVRRDSLQDDHPQRRLQASVAVTVMGAGLGLFAMGLVMALVDDSYALPALGALLATSGYVVLRRQRTWQEAMP